MVLKEETFSIIGEENLRYRNKIYLTHYVMDFLYTLSLFGGM